MYQFIQISLSLAHFVRKAGKKITLPVKTFTFLLCFLPGIAAFSQQTSKVQEAVNSIKEVFNNTENDYITDGQRTVWVKSYKNWTPEDLPVMVREVPGVINFLRLAAQHKRYDVLEQILPDYYITHGGAKAFADDIIRLGQ